MSQTLSVDITISVKYLWLVHLLIKCLASCPLISENSFLSNVLMVKRQHTTLQYFQQKEKEPGRFYLRIHIPNTVESPTVNRLHPWSRPWREECLQTTGIYVKEDLHRKPRIFVLWIVSYWTNVLLWLDFHMQKKN